MLPVNRTTVVAGPCLIPFNGANLYSAGDVTVTPKKVLFDVPTSRFGKRTDQRLKDFYYTIGFVPSGEVTNALLANYFPYYNLSCGSSIFGVNDVPMQIIGTEVGSNRLTFRNVVLTKMPDVNLKSSGTVFGAVEFTAIGGNGIPFSNADRVVAVDTLAYPADTFNVADIITGAYTGAWANAIPTGNFTVTETNPAVFTAAAHGMVAGDQVTIAGCVEDVALNGGWFIVNPTANTFEIAATAGGAPIANAVGADAGTYTRSNAFDAFDTEDGFTITHGLDLMNKTSNNQGLYNILFSSLDVSCKATPLGVSMAQLLAALNSQGATAAIGKSMSAEGLNLTLSGQGLYFQLAQAALRDGPMMWSSDKDRVGAVVWGATRTFAGGAAVPLATISTAPIAIPA